jgi:hypothetical protein
MEALLYLVRILGVRRVPNVSTRSPDLSSPSTECELVLMIQCAVRVPCACSKYRI